MQLRMRHASCTVHDMQSLCLGGDIRLRPYQGHAVDAIESELSRVRSTVAVMATGLGKTIVFAELCRRHVQRGGRVLVLAHRKELIDQAARKIEAVTGIAPSIEQGDRKDFSPISQIVVGSVQSMVRRLERFAEDDFSLVITDECHRRVTAQHGRVVDHFSGAKELGVTATATRGDKVSLGKIYESVAYEYEIAKAIPDGWLVPIHQRTIETDIDFSKIRTTAGDFNQGELSTVMSDPRSIYQIAGPTVEMAGDRQVLVFAVTVAHAHALAAGIRDMTQSKVEVLDGTTPGDERARVIEAFKDGSVRYLVNCALFIEGFDAPSTAVIAMARPTKSKLLYMQSIGRGTRPIDGVVDHHAGSASEVRRDAIARSPKPHVLVLDFVGNSGRHTLCNASSILDGVATPPQLAIAEKYLVENVVDDVLEAFQRAKDEISKMELERMKAQARRNFRTMRVDPFQALGIERIDDPYDQELTKRQKRFLGARGIPHEGMSRRQGIQLIGELIARKRVDRATYKQTQLLIKRGLDPRKVVGISFDQASSLIDVVARNGWHEPEGWASDLRYDD